MSQPNILVVDDDPEIGRLLGKYLDGQGFRCAIAANRRSCEQKIADSRVDLVVLDVMLPDGSGLDICRDIKERRPEIAIILLTALKEDVDRIIGLELGADDYLGKPFNPRELAARIRAVLRRGGGAESMASDAPSAGIFAFEGFSVDPERRSATAQDGEDVPLTGAEFDLLMIFLERPGRVLSRDVLMDLLHGRSADPFRSLRRRDDEPAQAQVQRRRRLQAVSRPCATAATSSPPGSSAATTPRPAQHSSRIRAHEIAALAAGPAARRRHRRRRGAGGRHFRFRPGTPRPRELPPDLRRGGADHCDGARPGPDRRPAPRHHRRHGAGRRCRRRRRSARAPFPRHRQPAAGPGA